MAKNLFDDFRDIDTGERTPLDDFIDTLNVRLIGRGESETRITNLRDFVLPTFLLVYCKTGTLRLSHGGEDTILEPDSLYIFSPYELYSLTRLGKTRVKFYYLMFNVTPYMSRYYLAASALSSADALFLQEGQYGRFGFTLEELSSFANLENGLSATLRQLIKLILARILYDQHIRGKNLPLMKHGRGHALISQAFQYTENHLNEPLIINNIIREASTSKTSLDRAFHDILDTTPSKALMRLKIDHSMEMLRLNTPVQTIARDLGFYSVYHFSNTFKAVTGIRPTRYRGEFFAYSHFHQERGLL